MATKDIDPEASKPTDDKAQQLAIEEKVRQMLELEPKSETKVMPETETISATTAPELKSAAEESTGPIIILPENPTKPPEPKTEQIPVSVADGSLVEDPEIDKVVDEIIAKEADDLLEAENEKLAEAFDGHKPKPLVRIKDAWLTWWRNPFKRRATIATIVVLLAGAIVVPEGRYFLLNTVGVRGGASLTILDDSTQQPLKNVSVRIGSQSGQTDDDGRVRLAKLRLGKNRLVVEKRAFAVLERDVTIGWGSNPLRDFRIIPTGAQYTFIFTDYLSGNPIDKVEASSDDASAFSDPDGVLKLTIDESNAEKKELEVTIKASEYREETVMLNLDSRDETRLQLVPSKHHVFISKRSGKYDVYRIDADGRDEVRILSGTGHERDDMVLVPHDNEELVALVSTRDNARNSDGFLLSTLTVIDLASNAPTKVAQSERIQVVNWIGKRLVFVQIAAGASTSDPKRHRLMSYDIESGQTRELAGANYFNDVFAIKSTIYYAPSSAYSEGEVALYKINADGTSKQTAFASEIWNVYRIEYHKLVLAMSQEWYEYTISDNKASKLSGEPANLRFRIYADSPAGHHSLWVDERDGKGVLVAYDLQTKTDDVVHEQSGLKDPVRWLSNDAVVYRVSTADETADYVMSLSGGEPKKLRDVTNTAGIDRWYYY